MRCFQVIGKLYSKMKFILDSVVVASQVVNIVDIMDSADITDINIAAVTTPSQ